MIGGQGFVSGEEFVTSVEEAAKINSVVVLGDRDFGLSMQRLAEASSKTDVRKVLEADKVMAAMMKEEIPWIDQWDGSKRPTNEDVQGVIEELKTKAIVDKMMNIFKEYAPAMYVAMVEERDTCMSVRLDGLTSFPTTVAVMGLAHVNGVTNNLEAIGWRRVPKQCWLE
jgi:pheromone shutdown protein TraB